MLLEGVGIICRINTVSTYFTTQGPNYIAYLWGTKGEGVAAIIKREFADVQLAGLQTNRVGKLKKQCSRNMAGKYPQTDSSRMESISLERRKNPGLYCWCEIFVATVYSV